MNLYGTTGNNTLGNIDWLGLDWHIFRNPNEPWASAGYTAKADTFRSLADKLHLNYDERTKWLKHAETNVFVTEEEEACPDSAYKVPNVMVVYTSKSKIGDGIVMFVTHLKRIAVQIGQQYQSKKYNLVLREWHSSEEDFIKLWETDGIYAIAFAGHGSVFGYEAAPGSGDAVNPIHVSPPYKLQAVYALSCKSAQYLIGNEIGPDGEFIRHKWKKHVSNSGTFWGYTGLVNWVSQHWQEVKENDFDIPD